MHSPVVVVTLARIRVDRVGPHAEPQVDQLVTVVVVAGERQFLRVPGADVGGQPDAVVGGKRLLAEDRDPPLAGLVAGAQRLDEAVTDHAVADDNGMASRHVGPNGTSGLMLLLTVERVMLTRRLMKSCRRSVAPVFHALVRGV